ncbi:MAG TPA: DUF5752 family protein [Candidatus Polarisedimenticolaceae bacterium]|nr:DUF5752 family protein [Candidatus Polarisedimenticolaceae bacterium]
MVTPAPFRVMDCSATVLAIGRSALTLRELRDHVAAAPADSVSHHFYDALLRPEFDHPEFRNDFARWAIRQLGDVVLAERLGALDALDHPDPEALRGRLLEAIEDRLAELPQVPQTEPGKEFHFLRSQYVVLDTGLSAATPADLAALVPQLSTGSVFYHFIDARRRPPVGEDDLSSWLHGWGPDYQPICRRLADIDVYLWSLSELRERVAACLAARGA